VHQHPSPLLTPPPPAQVLNRLSNESVQLLELLEGDAAGTTTFDLNFPHPPPPPTHTPACTLTQVLNRLSNESVQLLELLGGNLAQLAQVTAPIHSRARALTAAQHNIAAAKDSMDKLLQHLDTSRRVSGGAYVRGGGGGGCGGGEGGRQADTGRLLLSPLMVCCPHTMVSRFTHTTAPTHMHLNTHAPTCTHMHPHPHPQVQPVLEAGPVRNLDGFPATWMGFLHAPTHAHAAPHMHSHTCVCPI
jgi:hypothetical protein